MLVILDRDSAIVALFILCSLELSGENYALLNDTDLHAFGIRKAAGCRRF